MDILTGIDILSVQRYIFASNRLRDVVSASWLVHWATANDGTLSESGGKVLLAGGGNAIIIFADIDQARQFAATFTRKLHDEAPGLEVIIVHRAYSPGKLANELEHLQIDLTRAKLKRLPSVPQLGLSVTTPCNITGLPANGFDPQNHNIPLCNMVRGWRNPAVFQRAMLRWTQFLNGNKRFDFPIEIDDMGRSRGDTSLIGIVHIDGNGIGEMITKWLHQCIENSVPDEFIVQQMQNWSNSLSNIVHHSLETITNRVISSVNYNANNIPFITGITHLEFALAEKNHKTLLPLRPILLGGDDLTFICDGRIALDLAEIALDTFSREIPTLGKVNACAGVAIVPAHTPFVRAYELAERLCANAKQKRSEQRSDESWLDWHIGASRPHEQINDLRNRAYAHHFANSNYLLTCRPYRLGNQKDERETWRWLSQTVLGTKNHGFRTDDWQQHRNKLKELASIVREGPDAVRWVRQSWTAAAKILWPEGLEPDDSAAFFDGNRTPLLDAIELLDLHLPLSSGEAS